jgi:hypothetical protein
LLWPHFNEKARSAAWRTGLLLSLGRSRVRPVSLTGQMDGRLIRRLAGKAARRIQSVRDTQP